VKILLSTAVLRACYFFIPFATEGEDTNLDGISAYVVLLRPSPSCFMQTTFQEGILANL
jgi:hypothetical protein